MYGVLIAHNPKVAGSNPAPATNGAKHRSKALSEALGRAFVVLEVVFGLAQPPASIHMSSLVSCASTAGPGDFGLAAKRSSERRG